VETPVVYFAVGHYGHRAGVMITASHNPPEYNGFKLCREQAIPISGDTGLEDIKHLYEQQDFDSDAPPGTIIRRDPIPSYIDHVCGFVQEISRLKVVVDAGNGMAGRFFPLVAERFPELEVVPLYFDLDGRFPNHEANPLKPENMVDLQTAIREHDADLGIAFDGDGDRVMFVDNHAELVSSDMLTVLIAQNYLAKEPGATVLYDLRSSRAVPEEIEEAGGKALMCRVGHAFIKQMLRDAGGIFAGELSGHYYFRDNFYADNGLIAALMVLELVGRRREPLSRILEPIHRYRASGEINSRVADPDGKLDELAQLYPDENEPQRFLDGLLYRSHETPWWWFNVRKSNTEPVLRLNCEAETEAKMIELRDHLLEIIRA
jgi:phosphomannomutase